MKRLIYLLLISPIVHNANVTKRRRLNTSILYEPIDAIDIAFDFPKLADVLPTLVQKTSIDYENESGVVVKNISIDIDKINIAKFKKKIAGMAKSIAKDEPKVNASRRQAVLSTEGDKKAYTEASEFMIKRKTLDLMLQTIYMARHKVATLENDKHFDKSKKDTGYRIAYSYRRILRIYTKMMRIYTYSNKYKNYYKTPNEQLILHKRVTRLHVDLEYLFKVMMNIDGKFKAKTKAEQAEADKSSGNTGKPDND
ncbi:uncharacterized protein LOC124634881 [Helicoverpa zea]|uniref:uncharacterized protein LOC124634881 n=1 Tax=Helicoverpa zea TaxID=7113 RepID=UPI001F59B812|nr:uncharacterized protein LOC124634881 [Helicoverpa zea]